jgi:hypothetical protein
MTKKLAILCFSLRFLLLFAQEKTQLSFDGKLIFNDFSSISYKLNIGINENGDFDGIAVKDVFVENPKALKVTGFINFDQSTISFLELNAIHKRGRFEEHNECMIHVSLASLSSLENKVIVEGEFTGISQGDKPCYKGKVILTAPKKAFQKFYKSYAESSVQSTKKEEHLLQQFYFDKEYLTKDNFQNIKLLSPVDFIEIQLWDQEVEDGDIVDITINERIFKKDLAIQNEKQSFRITVETDKIVIEIKAKNTGSIFPNTMSMNVIATPNMYSLKTKLKKEEVTFLVISLP